MSGDDMSLDEKRVYAETRSVTTLYVASSLGLAEVRVAGDQTGRMRLVYNGTVRDVAGGGGHLLVATDEDVLVGTGEDVEPTDFGPATAVGVAAEGDLLVAASPDGTVARLVGDDWDALGDVAEPRRFDGASLAAGDRVYRIEDGSLEGTGGGLDTAVRDVAAAGPYAATADGLSRLGEDGWIVEREGACEVVAADGDRAHLVADDDLFERDVDEWVPCSLPVEETVADVAYGQGTYAVTRAGTILVDADPETTPDGSDGWRHRSLGLPSVMAVAVP